MYKSLKAAIFILALFANINISLAYDDVLTHPDMATAAVKSSTLKTSLPQKLGSEFVKNEETVIKGNSIVDWIRKGAKLEDNIETCRKSTHFHNPLKS